MTNHFQPASLLAAVAGICFHLTINTAIAAERTLFDFSTFTNASAWQIVNDDVMGGVSSSRFSVTNGVASFAASCRWRRTAASPPCARCPHALTLPIAMPSSSACAATDAATSSARAPTALSTAPSIRLHSRQSRASGRSCAWGGPEPRQAAHQERDHSATSSRRPSAG
mgnify:CR=1 FL=1